MTIGNMRRKHISAAHSQLRILPFALAIGLILFAFEKCSAQTIEAGAGATYNSLKGVGYYIGVKSQGMFTDRASLGIEFQFTNQHGKINSLNESGDTIKISVNSNSFNGIFALQYYAIKEKLYLLGGFSTGVILKMKIDDKKVEDVETIRFSGVAGIGYRFKERFDVGFKYFYPVNGDYFNHNFQLGVNYRIKSSQL